MARTRAVAGSEAESIIGAVYEAAFDPARWPDALRAVGDTIAADSSFFFSTHSDVDPGAVLHVFNQPDEMLQGFTSFWHTQDEWALAAQRKGLMRRGTLVLGSELVPRKDFHRTAFYSDFTRHHDIDAMVGTVLFDGTEPEAMPFTNLVWYRGTDAADFEFADRDRLKTFIPHFQRSLQIRGEPARFTTLVPGARPQVIAATLIRIAPGSSESFGPATEDSDRFLLLAEVPRINGREVAEAVASLFKLSRAEARVLGALLDGATPAQIAAAGGNAVATVRTQISSLLAKTETASQTDLLVLLRGLRV